MAEVKKTARKPSRAGKRLNEAEQTEAIELWKAGSTTLDELAEKFSRSRGTFIRLFNAKGVAKGESSAEHTREVAAAVKTAALGDVETTAKRINETKEEHYKIASYLSKLVWNLIAQAQKDGRSYATIGPDIKALKYAADIFKTTRDERYALLGLNERESLEDDEIGDLVIQEITQEEILQKQKEEQPEGEDSLLMPDIDNSEIEDVPAVGELE